MSEHEETDVVSWGGVPEVGARWARGAAYQPKQKLKAPMVIYFGCFHASSGYQISVTVQVTISTMTAVSSAAWRYRRG